MSEQGKPDSPVSRLIRERAMTILRETRAKIDPQLLNAMKEHLTAAMPQVAGVGAPKADPDMPLSSGGGAKPANAADATLSIPKASAPAAAAAYRATPSKPASFSQELSSVIKTTPEKKTIEQAETKVAYPSKTIEEISSEKVTEPVDKQKIAQIVLQYMKNREEKSKH